MTLVNPSEMRSVIFGYRYAAFNQAVPASSYIKSGKVRALVLAAPRRLPILPDVPSSSEAAMPDLQVNARTTFFAPKDTPEAVIRKLNSAVGKAFDEDDVVKRLSALGVDIPSPRATNARCA
jgi:tripartite-type tricarboxylate transporter receptor subunit TctC